MPNDFKQDRAQRRARLLQRLRRELAHYESLPAPERTRYAREADYKRAVTVRQGVVRRLRRQIKTLEEGRPFSEWPNTKLEENHA